jgi:hypothetical protein
MLIFQDLITIWEDESDNDIDNVCIVEHDIKLNNTSNTLYEYGWNPWPVYFYVQCTGKLPYTATTRNRLGHFHHILRILCKTRRVMDRDVFGKLLELIPDLRRGHDDRKWTKIYSAAVADYYRWLPFYLRVCTHQPLKLPSSR